jgi:hypothetical protein
MDNHGSVEDKVDGVQRVNEGTDCRYVSLVYQVMPQVHI